ncbi:MAG: DUF362 domain-containing protein [Proteobacteria bacterium]|nr:DUF362 domain-containing protein [Pseudomonadota bacterium]
MPKVFLLPLDSKVPKKLIEEKITTLWLNAGFDSVFKSNELVALKLHVGEPGTKTFTSPAIARSLVHHIAARDARPFLTDTSVLYRSPRDNAIGHIRVANEHGFGVDAMGVPFIPADGLNGSDEREVEVGGKHYEKVAIAAGIMQSRSMLVLSHATGHLGTGLGGAIKNLGMGCSSKKAKLSQHYGQQPSIDKKKCIACAECESWCPSEAIQIEERAEIDKSKCIGCGECVAVCQDGAVKFEWSIMGRELQERIVEHAAAVVRSKPGRICYVTVAQKITKDCDCLGIDQKPLLDDIGILASFDPVAIDQAVLDLIKQNAGCTLESMSYPKTDSAIQIRYAESLGLGDSNYNLVTIED